METILSNELWVDLVGFKFRKPYLFIFRRKHYFTEKLILFIAHSTRLRDDTKDCTTIEYVKKSFFLSCYLFFSFLIVNFHALTSL